MVFTELDILQSKKNDDYENIYVTTGILTILVLSMNRIFAMVVTI